MEELDETQQYAAKRLNGERRHSQAPFECEDRRKPEAAEDKSLEDHLDRPETD